MAECALWYKTQGLNLFQALDKIYEEYGFSAEHLLNLNYYGKEGADKIKRIMDKFRSMNPTEICGQKVVNFWDYDKLIEKNILNGEEMTIDLPPTNALGFGFDTESRFFLRPSGTEPKIKFYIQIKEINGNLEEKKRKAKEMTHQLLEFIKKECEEA
jgi:phosphoglucomutase